MAQQLADRVKETVSAPGTSAFALGGAMTGFQPFSAVCANGDTPTYAAQSVDSSGNPNGGWETGIGTYATSGNTLTRTTILSSSNAGAAVNFAGNVQVWLDLPAGLLPLFSLNTASPNAAVPVVGMALNNSATNVDASIVPKGTGALQAAIPDGTSAGGNKRGTYSVDWQTKRSTAAQVASGAYAVIAGGIGNTASGANYPTVAGGSGNSSSGTSGSTIGGGNNNSSTNTYSTVGGGNSNNASGASSTIAGGNTNSATGTFTFVGSGFSNSASGNYASVLGGNANTASGVYSAVAGGNGSVASGSNSTTMGSYATTNTIIGQVSLGFGSTTLGQFQRTFTQLRASTTSTTATVATADGTAAATTNQLTLRAKSAFRVRLTAVAFDATNFTDAKEWVSDVLIVRGSTAASTTLIGAPTITSTFATAGASGWTLAVSADTTNGALKVTVTSSTTDAVDWNVQLDAIEVM